MKEILTNNLELKEMKKDYTIDQLLSVFNLSLNDIENIKSIDDFSNIKEYILGKINKYLEPKYINEDDNFKKSFEEGRYNAFKSENIDKHKKILNLFNIRNEIYLNILVGLLKNGKFNNILGKNDIINLIFLLESDLLLAIDNLAKNIKIDLIKNNFYKNENTKGLHYGYIKNGKIISWKKICNHNLKIPICYVENMQSGYLEKYLNGFLNLIEKNNTNYDDFIKLEENEVKSWKNNEKLTFTVPMENYDHPNTIDLGFEFHLSKPVENEELNKITNLSEKYFGSGYNMQKISLAFTEMLITSGDNNLKIVLGRSFPNDKRLSDKYGKIIYIAKNRNLKLVEKTCKDLKKIGLNPNESLHKLIRLEEVKFHEFGHSLFSNIKPKNTILEELKATLYYFLYLYERKEKLDNNDKKTLIEFIIGEFIRRISQKNVKSAYQYWLLENYIFDKAVKNNLIELNNNKIIINTDNINFNNFLEDLKKTLFDIKKIYSIKDNNKRAEDELKFIGNIFEDNSIFLDYFQKNNV